jgi:hypothetical protein
MERQLALIADSANISAEGKLNVLGEFDTLFAETVPVRHPTFFFVSKLFIEGSDIGDRRLMLRLVDEDGNLVLPPLTARLSIPAPGPELGGLRRSLPIVLQIQEATFPAFGAYVVELRVDDEVLAEVPLYLRPLQGAREKP